MNNAELVALLKRAQEQLQHDYNCPVGQAQRHVHQVGPAGRRKGDSNEQFAARQAERGTWAREYVARHVCTCIVDEVKKAVNSHN